MQNRKRKTPMPKEVLILGKNIARIIKEKNLKTREVAHDAGMDVENLRKYIKGTQEMKVSTLVRVARAIDCSIDKLLE